jgi:hypothetical protein
MGLQNVLEALILFTGFRKCRKVNILEILKNIEGIE